MRPCICERLSEACCAGAVYLDVNGDIEQTWEVWKPLLHPFYSPDNVPVHPVVMLTNYCQLNGHKLEFVSANKQDSNEGKEGLLEMDTSDTEEEEDKMIEQRSGRYGLLQLEEERFHVRRLVQVVVNGKVVGNGEGPHVKAAKRAAALAALQTAPWN